MTHRKIKVLIVEDSPVMRQMLEYVLGSDPQVEVIGSAAGGMAALEFLKRSKPDVITMDIAMPKMDGFEVTRRIMETQPVPVVIVSASWKDAEVTTSFKAVEAGAVAVVGKPHGIGHPRHAEESRQLLDTVKAMAEVRVVRRWSRLPHEQTRSPSPAGGRSQPVAGPFKVVAIGASTGGPLVLQTLLSKFPRNYGVPVLIVQHIAAGFLQGLVDWLQTSSGFPTRIAAHGDVAAPGTAYLAPDSQEMGISPDGRILLNAGDPRSLLRPSVAHLFTSVARSFGPSAVGVLLTGMGSDGADELKLMRDFGALTIAQDQESCIIFGMPGEAVKLGAATHVLPPERIASLLAGINTPR